MAFQLETNVHVNHPVPFHRNPLKVIVNSTSVNKINKITGFFSLSFTKTVTRLTETARVNKIACSLTVASRQPARHAVVHRTCRDEGRFIADLCLPLRSQSQPILCVDLSLFADTYRRVTRLDIYLWNQTL